MNHEPDAPKRGGMFGLMLAHVVCCGGVLLVASGALTLSGIGDGCPAVASPGWPRAPLRWPWDSGPGDGW